MRGGLSEVRKPPRRFFASESGGEAMWVAKGLLVTALVAASAAHSPAQTAEGPRGRPHAAARCPTVTVSCPDFPEKVGQVVYTANVSGGDPSVTPAFDWTVSAGTIIGGQGTGSITVDVTGAGYGAWTATVEVRGYDRGCWTSNSCTQMVHPPREPRKLDEFGDMRFRDERPRLDNFVAELRNDPSARGYVICYGGGRGGAVAARGRCARARGYLVRTQHPSRIVTVEGGMREGPSVELWVVPSGATLPRPTPSPRPREVRAPARPGKPRRPLR